MRPANHALAFFIFVFILLGLFGGGYYFLTQFQQTTTPPAIAQQISPTPQPDPEMITPDGTKKVTEHIVHTKAVESTYSFTVTNLETGATNTVFSKTSVGDITIPHNTWSPDNKYLFFLEKAGTTTGVLVAQASGNYFANGQPYIDVVPLYEKKNYPYLFDEATGWAAPTLLIINTRTQDNAKGPSFWFDVPSQSFIQLSTKF